MKKLLSLLLFLHSASTVKHSLTFWVSITSGLPNLPEFWGVLDIDEVLAGYYDSNIKTVKVRPDWAKKLVKLLQQSDPRHLQWYVDQCTANYHELKTTIDMLVLQSNQTAGVHVLQWMSGCERNDETGDVTGLSRYGYDGEDIIEFDMQTMTWISHSPKTASALRWNNDEARLQFINSFYLHQCPEMLKLYVNYTRGFLQRRGHPSVSLLQRTPSSPVSCFATGFFPNKALIFWRKDGEELHEDVEMGELLPNHDGTFQISADLNVSSVREDEWGSYDCVFQLSGVTDDIITKLDRKAIKTNWVSPSEFPTAAVIGGVIGGGLVLLAVAAGVRIWRRNKAGFHPVSGGTSETASSPQPPQH